MTAPSVHRVGPIRQRLVPSLPEVVPSWASTHQARVLNPAIIGAEATEHGMAMGVNEATRTGAYQDQFTNYVEGRSSNPNVIVAGPVGSGKSMLVKTAYVMRPLMLLLRRAVIIDLKPRGTDGDSEYGDLTRAWGSEPYLFWPGHSDCTRVNPLDPVVLAGGGQAAGASLLNAIADLGGEGTPPPLQQDTLRVAHRALLGKYEGVRTPTLPDLVEMMPTVASAPKYAGYRDSTRDQVDAAALLMQTRLERALADDVAGLFDGDTTPGVGMPRKLTTYNIANLPSTGPAMAMVMAVAHAQLMGMLQQNPDRWRTTLIMEEAWAFEAVAKQIQRYEKLARGLGVSNVGVLQHLSDAAPGSAGEALVREAGTAHIFRQEQQVDIDDCIRTFGIDPGNADLLRTLPQGQHLMKVGTAREVHVRGVVTPTEFGMTETDEGMKGHHA